MPELAWGLVINFMEAPSMTNAPALSKGKGIAKGPSFADFQPSHATAAGDSFYHHLQGDAQRAALRISRLDRG